MNTNLDFFFIFSYSFLPLSSNCTLILSLLTLSNKPISSWEYVILVTQGEEVNYYELDHDKVTYVSFFSSCS